MVQAQAAPSPSYRTVRTYEHNAQLNAMRRARDVANWSAGSNVEEVRQLDGLIAALEERKYESDGSRKRFIEKTEERQQKLQQKDSELLQLLVAGVCVRALACVVSVSALPPSLTHNPVAHNR